MKHIPTISIMALAAAGEPGMADALSYPVVDTWQLGFCDNHRRIERPAERDAPSFREIGDDRLSADEFSVGPPGGGD